MATIDFDVKGMTCEHCERAVTEEVSKVKGAEVLSVSATTGLLTISVADEIDDFALVAAVEEAGYSASRRRENAS